MNWDSAFHAPVMVREVVELLGNAQHVLDGTLGGGGHTAALLERGVQVTAVDRDASALAVARERLAPYISRGRLRVVESNFAQVADRAEFAEIRFNGILLDLGVSSHQFDDETRGFTFRRGAALDMRMGDDAERTAAAVLNESSREDLVTILSHLADEPRAGRMAAEIVRRRHNAPFQTSDDLVGAIRAVLGPQAGPAEFARIFQGFRIAVNDELAALEEALPALRDRLAPGGLMVVISYHSGEDRLVKHAFQEWSRTCVCPPRQPICTCRGVASGVKVTRKSVVPSADETAVNPRARSARLRAWRSAA